MLKQLDPILQLMLEKKPMRFLLSTAIASYIVGREIFIVVMTGKERVMFRIKRQKSIVAARNSINATCSKLWNLKNTSQLDRLYLAK